MRVNCNIDHEVVNNGFSPLVQTPGLFLCIVIESIGGEHLTPTYAVYMRHGSPGGQFWRTDPPIRREDSLEKARQLVDTLAGLHDAHKHFPVYQCVHDVQGVHYFEVHY